MRILKKPARYGTSKWSKIFLSSINKPNREKVQCFSFLFKSLKSMRIQEKCALIAVTRRGNDPRQMGAQRPYPLFGGGVRSIENGRVAPMLGVWVVGPIGSK